MPITASQPVLFRGNDRLLYGIILGVITFWLFAQTTLNIAPAMGRDLGLGASTMNTAVAITSLFSGYQWMSYAPMNPAARRATGRNSGQL